MKKSSLLFLSVLLYLSFSSVILVEAQDIPTEVIPTDEEPEPTSDDPNFTRIVTRGTIIRPSATIDEPTATDSTQDTWESTSSTEDTTSTTENTSTSTSTSSSTSLSTNTSSSTSSSSSTSELPSSTSEMVSTLPTVSVSQVTSTSTQTFYMIQGSFRLAPDFSTIKNKTQFALSMSSLLTNYFGYPTEVVQLKSGSIIVIYVIVAPDSSANSIISMIAALQNSAQFGGYEVIPAAGATSASPVNSGSNTSNSSGGTSIGLIAGVAGGVAAVIIIAALILVIIVMKKKKGNKEEERKMRKDLEKGNESTEMNDWNSPVPVLPNENRNNYNDLNPPIALPIIKSATLDSDTIKSSTSNATGDASYRSSSFMTNNSSLYNGSNNNLHHNSNQFSHVFLKNVIIGEKLADGKFGDVFYATWNLTTPVALKAMKNVESEGDFLYEVSLLMKLNHPNVVRAIGVFRDQNSKLYLAMEYLSKGSLANFLRKPNTKNALSTMDLLNMSIHVAAGMNYLENQKIIHRDLAARNLLVTEVDGKYAVKIADLGLSRESTNGASVYMAKENASLPIKWSPPEVIEYSSYSHKSDVWSFAISLWEIFEYGTEPYPGMTNVRTMHAVIAEGYRLPRPVYCPVQVYELMLKCWSLDPNLRPSFEEIWKELTEIEDTLKSSSNYGYSPMVGTGGDNSLGNFDWIKTAEMEEIFLSEDDESMAPTPLLDRRDSSNYIRTFDDVQK